MSVIKQVLYFCTQMVTILRFLHVHRFCTRFSRQSVPGVSETVTDST